MPYFYKFKKSQYSKFTFILISFGLVLIALTSCVTTKKKYTIQTEGVRNDTAVPIDAPGPVGDSGVPDLPSSY